MILTDEYNQTIDFSIPDQYKKIGVRCSGGADSSILLYMLVKYFENKDVIINVLTCSNDEKHRWNGRRAADVINYVIDKTKTTKINMHYSYYKDVQNVEYFDTVEKNLFEQQNIDCVISGLTACPDEGETVKTINGNVFNLYPPEPAYRIGRNKPSWINHYYTPFINVDKRFIASMYKKYAVKDLVQLTRSCEDMPAHNYYNPEFEYTPCGECWWCLERKWAFGEF